MIRVQVTDEHRSIDLRSDTAYSPDVLDDIVARVVMLMIAGQASEVTT